MLKIKNDTISNIRSYIKADNASALLAYWDKNQICRFINNACFKWFGKTSEEIINKISIKELLGEELYEKNYSYISSALRGYPQAFEREIKLPNGEIKKAFANYMPDINNGIVEGFFVNVTDATFAKKRQKEQFIRSTEFIKMQNEKLLNFSNIVTHNLKAYSTNLSTLLSLYTSTKNEQEKTETLLHLKNISNGFSNTVSHLNEIVVAQNLSGLPPQQINVHKYVEESIKFLKLQIETNDAKIINNTDPELNIYCNPAYMESILLNLLSNAIKYRHPERIPYIEIESSTKDTSYIEIKVKDNGLGIDLNKYKNDIFGMYKTFHGNSDANGIGLYIVKYQIEAIGGYIELESEVNKGSCFYIYFNNNS